MEYSLKNIRLTLGYKQQEFADTLEVNVNTYRGYEYQKRDLPTDFLLKLVNTFNVNLHYLYTGTGTMFTSENINSFEVIDDSSILKNFKNLSRRYTKMITANNMTDFEVSKLTGISETKLQKIGLGLEDITMPDFLKLRSKIEFDANWLLFGISEENNSAESDNKFSAEEVELIKKLYKKISY